MQVQLQGLHLSGISSALPRETLNIPEMNSQFGESELKRIMANTGVETVHVARDGMQASDLCELAAKDLFEKMRIDPKTIGAIVFVSQTPDRIAPATSCLLQHRLGLPTSSVAFDINYGCSGYLYGLYQAALLLASNSCQRVLVCTGDVITPLLHPESHQLRLLLGDAGTASLIEKGSDNWAFVINTDGSGDQHLTAAKTLPKTDLPQDLNNKKNGYYHMDGNQVMGFAMKVVPEVVNQLTTQKNWSLSEIGTFGLHQPNEFMLRFLRKKLRATEESVPIAVKTVGNAGPASIPLMLSMTGNERKQKRQLDKTILSGFGVGLSWGGVALSLSNTQFFEPIEV